MPGMKWIEPIFFSKTSRNLIFSQIFGHQRAKIDARNVNMNRGPKTHPIKVIARYEMKWANSFLKKFRKPCLHMVGWTVARKGESNILVPPFYNWGSGGIMIWALEYVNGEMSGAEASKCVIVSRVINSRWTTGAINLFNTLKLRQNGHYFPDDIFKCVFLEWKGMNFD